MENPEQYVVPLIGYERQARGGDGLVDCELLRMSEVVARTGLSQSTIYKMVKMGEFPPPVNLGSRARAWPSFAVNAWLASRIAAREAMRTPHDKVVLPLWTADMEKVRYPLEIRVLRLPEVKRRTRLGRTQIYKDPFPRPVPLGLRASGWLAHEVSAWIQNRLEERRADPGFRFLTHRQSAPMKPDGGSTRAGRPSDRSVSRVSNAKAKRKRR